MQRQRLRPHPHFPCLRTAGASPSSAPPSAQRWEGRARLRRRLCLRAPLPTRGWLSARAAAARGSTWRGAGGRSALPRRRPTDWVRPRQLTASPLSTAGRPLRRRPPTAPRAQRSRSPRARRAAAVCVMQSERGARRPVGTLEGGGMEVGARFALSRPEITRDTSSSSGRMRYFLPGGFGQKSRGGSEGERPVRRRLL